MLSICIARRLHIFEEVIISGTMIIRGFKISISISSILYNFPAFLQDSLIETLRRTRIHFVHCLLPQNFAGLCDLKGGQRSSQKSSDDDVVLNVPLLRSQLRGHQLIEAVRIYRQGRQICENSFSDQRVLRELAS